MLGQPVSESLMWGGAFGHSRFGVGAQSARSRPIPHSVCTISRGLSATIFQKTFRYLWRFCSLLFRGFFVVFRGFFVALFCLEKQCSGLFRGFFVAPGLGKFYAYSPWNSLSAHFSSWDRRAWVSGLTNPGNFVPWNMSLRWGGSLEGPTHKPRHASVFSTHSDTQAVAAFHCVRMFNTRAFNKHRHAVYHCLKEVQKPFRHASVFKTRVSSRACPFFKCAFSPIYGPVLPFLGF